jgi:hypothetical protein
MMNAEEVIRKAKKVVREQEWQILSLEAEVDRLYEVVADLRKRLEEKNG